MGTTDLPALPPSRSPLSARAFGPHLLIGDLIGRGGMSRVYRGWIRGSGLEVAVKVLRDDLAARPDAVQRFVRERDLLATVASPHVVQVHDLVVHGDEVGIVMDLVPGGHLRRAVTFPCTLGTAAELAAQIADGLAAVHAAGVVHRDLKPENVLVEAEPDGSNRLRLTDFGISRLVDSAALTQTSVTGTPGYLAPEVAAGHRVTAAADMYALGVLLYELCTGRQPFLADNPLLLVLAHTRQPPPRPLGMPDALWEVLAQTLAKDPTARPTAAGAASTLRGLVPELTGLPPCTVPPPAPDVAPAPVPGAPDPGAPGPAVMDVTVAASSLAGATMRRDDGRPPAYLRPQPLVPGSTRGRDVPRQARHSPERSPGRQLPARLPVLVAGAVAIIVALVIGGVLGLKLLGNDGGNPIVRLRSEPSQVAAGPSPSAPTKAPITSDAGDAPAHHASTTPTKSPARAMSPSPRSPSPSSPTPSSPTPTLAPGTPTVNVVAATPSDRHSSDGHATLAISRVTASTGSVASVTIRYSGQGQPGGSQDVPVSRDPQATGYTATVSGLTNGTAYTFTVTVCNTARKCSTSQPLVFTPYGAPQVVAPTLNLTETMITIRVLPEVRNSNPGTTVCTVKVNSTPTDPGAPEQTVNAKGDTVTFTAKATTRYTATETCTTAGVLDGSMTSAEIMTGLI